MSNGNNYLENPAEAPPPGLGIGDIYYVLFRHKWKILFFALAGVVAAAVLYKYTKPTYYSEAKLMVKYVVEARSSGMARSDQQIQSASSGEGSVMNSELEILSSFDLCLQVVAAIGPERILGRLESGGTNVSSAKAAEVILKNLTVDQVRRGNVVRIKFTHPDPDLVQPVVRQLIKSYLDRHAEIHRPIEEGDDALVKQKDLLRSQLTETEELLRKLKARAGVLSVEDAKKEYTVQMSRIQQDIFNTKVEIAGLRVAAAEAGVHIPVTNQSNAANDSVPAAKLAKYNETLQRLASLRNKEFDYLSNQRYTEANPLVKSLRLQIGEIDTQKKELELATPGLANYSMPSAMVSAANPGSPSGGPEPLNLLRRMEARLVALEGQMAEVRTNVKILDETEIEISQLERKKAQDAKSYDYIASGVEQARTDEALGSRKLSNIIPVETETPPTRAVSGRLKLVGMALAGGLAVGIGLAFLIELFLDRTLKRPFEVATKLHLPLFFTFPRLAGGSRPTRPLIGGGADGTEPTAGSQVVAPAPFEDTMRPLMEDLRERTLQHFEGNNKKPKLVGITGCTVGAGVSTIASGLAATLSESGGGNVLLVDMNMGNGVAHPFFNGKSACAIVDAVEGEKRKAGFISENLYLAKAARGKDLESLTLPRRLSDIMPKLKASDFDFIVFDLPPITRTGSTLRLVGMMDLSLLVIEAEKDEQGVLTTAASLLGESKANVSVVLNKVRSYVPGWLQREL